jgi:hypothetical protein
MHMGFVLQTHLSPQRPGRRAPKNNLRCLGSAKTQQREKEIVPRHTKVAEEFAGSRTPCRASAIQPQSAPTRRRTFESARGGLDENAGSRAITDRGSNAKALRRRAPVYERVEDHAAGIGQPRRPRLVKFKNLAHIRQHYAISRMRNRI